MQEADAGPVRWEPNRTQLPPPWPVPPMPTALWRGAKGTCPGCGRSRLFRRFLKVISECPACGAPVGLARADDAPPYFTIVLTGHIVVPLLLISERDWAPPLWVQSAIFLPLTLLLAITLLQPIKGATVGAMLRLNMLKMDEE